MSYDEKIESIADEVCAHLTMVIHKQIVSIHHPKSNFLDFTELYYKCYKKHFGDRVDHRTYDKIEVLGLCTSCALMSMYEYAMHGGMSVPEMIRMMEKYIRLQVTKLKLWSV